MEIKNAIYEVTAVKPEQYPANFLPEIAFVGRSNIGKSSIINSLLHKKNLAHVGATPGKTRSSTFIILITNCILWIYRGTVMPRYPKPKRHLGMK